MTSSKVIRNVYCTEPEDRVIEWKCPCCTRCWLFVASRAGRKNNRCPHGGPFDGFIKEPTNDRSMD